MTKEQVEKIENITISLKTRQKRFSAKKITTIEFYIGRHRWRLANAREEELEKGRKGVFDLTIPADMTSDWFRYLCLKRIETKSGDDWIIIEIKLIVNGKEIYNKENCDIKLKADSSSWCAADFSYGGAG